MPVQILYDADVLEEELILSWDQSSGSAWAVKPEVAAKTREAAAPFVAW